MKLIERMMRAKHELVYEILHDYRRMLWACAAAGDRCTDIPLEGRGYDRRLAKLEDYAGHPVRISHKTFGELEIQAFFLEDGWCLRVTWDLP
jgi:hypothetical protein